VERSLVIPTALALTWCVADTATIVSIFQATPTAFNAINNMVAGSISLFNFDAALMSTRQDRLPCNPPIWITGSVDSPKYSPGSTENVSLKIIRLLKAKFNTSSPSGDVNVDLHKSMLRVFPFDVVSQKWTLPDNSSPDMSEENLSNTNR
jgi:hypothetical protein